MRAVEAGAIPTGNMTNACATAKFRWALRMVCAEVDGGRTPSNRLIEEVARLMSQPYVGEMDLTIQVDPADHPLLIEIARKFGSATGRRGC